MIEWLLGIDRLNPNDPNVVFDFARRIPAWGWALTTLGAFALAYISYTRLEGARLMRLLLGGARFVLILLIVLVLVGPQLERPNERTEEDWVVFLADRSASMTIADGEGGVAREAQLEQALAAAQTPIASLMENRRVLALGFDAGVFELGVGEDGRIVRGEPDGSRTLLGRSIDRALDEVAARPVAGVVLLTDGSSADAPTRRALQRLRNERIPVFSVPIGSPEPVTDIAIKSAVAPAAGFVNDRVPVTVEIDRIGRAQGGSARLELFDTATGLVLDAKDIDPDATSATLLTRPTDAGSTEWGVRVIPEGQDLLADNNERTFTIDLVDRPLRALQIDGYPRWEFRYTKNLLLREPTISSSSLLLSSRRRYVQEGDVEVAELPDSPGEWEGIDVVVIGDVRSDLFTEDQLHQIHDLVAHRGAGILWIAGPSATPDTWRGTPLEPLLPITLSTPASAWNEPVTMERAPAAARLGLLELSDDEAGGWPERLADPATGWALLRWAQRIEPDQIKPTAEVLASAVPSVTDDDPAPLVLSMRYGAGRSVYVGTDEIWRWRYARGEVLPERFWIPLVRLIGREGLARAGRSAVLDVSPAQTEPGAPVRIALRIIDEQLAQERPQTITATIQSEREGEAPLTVTLRPENESTTGSADAPLSVPTFSTIWLPVRPGAYSITITDAILSSIDELTESVDVLAPDDELRRPETDFEVLESLAAETGGRVLTVNELARLEEFLPNRQRRVTGTPDIETLWDGPLTLILFTLLLSVEWIGRRLIRLV